MQFFCKGTFFFNSTTRHYPQVKFTLMMHTSGWGAGSGQQERPGRVSPSVDATRPKNYSARRTNVARDSSSLPRKQLRQRWKNCRSHCTLRKRLVVFGPQEGVFCLALKRTYPIYKVSCLAASHSCDSGDSVVFLVTHNITASPRLQDTPLDHFLSSRFCSLQKIIIDDGRVGQDVVVVVVCVRYCFLLCSCSCYYSFLYFFFCVSDRSCVYYCLRLVQV